jgi:hypothetical protein
MRELPSPCRWLEFSDGAHGLHWNYGCVAVVYADGRIRIQWAYGQQIESRAGNVAQGKRYVEQWVAARKGWPPGKRAMALRERVRKGDPKLTPRHR